MRRCTALLSCLLLSLAGGGVHAQVHRCTTDAGTPLYTDRRCADVGAAELPAPAAPAAGSRYRGGCARTVRDLVYELTTALDTHDANRLAGVYLWTGMSSNQAYRVLERLDAIARRSLVDVVPILAPGPEGLDPMLYPQHAARRAPVGLRIEQTLANGTTPARAVFGLQRHFGCWWIRG